MHLHVANSPQETFLQSCGSHLHCRVALISIGCVVWFSFCITLTLTLGGSHGLSGGSHLHCRVALKIGSHLHCRVALICIAVWLSFALSCGSHFALSCGSHFHWMCRVALIFIGCVVWFSFCITLTLTLGGFDGLSGGSHSHCRVALILYCRVALILHCRVALISIGFVVWFSFCITLTLGGSHGLSGGSHLYCRVALILHCRVALILHCRVALISIGCIVWFSFCITLTLGGSHGLSGGSHSIDIQVKGCTLIQVKGCTLN